MRSKHGMTNTRLYRTWRGMLSRCYNPNRKDYQYYGGRGITVCDEWKRSFPTFYEWAMANGYSDSLTIDREDTSKNYEPSNCKWVSMKKQCENRRSNRILTAFGESYTISQWALITGINYTTIKGRIDRLGWSVEKALKTKIIK